MVKTPPKFIYEGGSVEENNEAYDAEEPVEEVAENGNGDCQDLVDDEPEDPIDEQDDNQDQIEEQDEIPEQEDEIND